MEPFAFQLDDCPIASASLSIQGSDTLDLCGCGTIVGISPSGELKLQLSPDRTLVIGRKNGGEIEYLDPRYQSSPFVPNSDRTILSRSMWDRCVSRGHFMLKGSPHGEGLVLVNGVPRRGGGIRPPLFWTKLLAPECRMMAPAEEYLIPPGTSVKIMLPNSAVILINAD
jgi:hypothetical protein